MSLFNDASLIITPNGVKAGKLYALKGDDLNVVRATSATYVGADGLIKTALANEVRFDYSNGSCPSILVEPQRTNSILNSATGTNQTVIVGNVPYTISFYGSGTVALSGTHTASVVGLGTARKTYTFTPTAGILIVNIAGTITNIQLEAGSFSTSYIPTTSASVTRNADVISKTGISSLIGQTEGVLFLDYQPLNVVDAYPIDFQLQYNGDNAVNGVTIYHAGNTPAITVRSGGSDIFSATLTATTVGTRNKIAIAYKNNSFAVYQNGVLKASQSTGIVPAILNEIRISDGNRNYSINSASVWKTRLTNTQLAELTTI